jgi:hypothetical protein
MKQGVKTSIAAKLSPLRALRIIVAAASLRVIFEKYNSFQLSSINSIKNPFFNAAKIATMNNFQFRMTM